VGWEEGDWGEWLQFVLPVSLGFTASLAVGQMGSSLAATVFGGISTKLMAW